MQYPSGKYAWTATVGEKGQIVIPKQARTLFGIEPGDTLLLLGDKERGLGILPKSALDKFTSMLFESADKENEEEK